MSKARGNALPHDHAVSYFDHDDEAVTAIVRFVVTGLAAGERVVVVASARHQAAVDGALRRVHAIDPEAVRAAGTYLTFDAQKTLDALLVDGSLDAPRFTSLIGKALATVDGSGPPVRVYGEMVGLLWQTGNVAAAIELEGLWNDVADQFDFTLLCGYPTSALRQSGLDDVAQVCVLHSSVQAPSNYPLTVSRGRSATDNQVSEVFLPVPEAVSALPQFVAGVLRSWGLDALLWDANLIATELAGNALRHRGSPFRGFVSRVDGVVRIGVEDIEKGLLAHHPEGPGSLGDRRVAIVQKLAHRWGCDVLPDGSTTWAELVATPA